MTKAGYKPLSARNSPEDEELLKFDSHLDPLCKDGSLMIEPHLSILGVGDDHITALYQIWKEKEEVNIDGVKVDHLSKEQFIVHTLLHAARHLSDEGFVEIKWFADLLYALKTWRVDWLKLMKIAEKWGVENDVLHVMAALNQYWQADILLPGTSEPIALNTLMLGIKDREKEYYANLPTSYLERLFKIMELPDTASRVRYLIHLFFPTQGNLRWRYNLSSKDSLPSYYILHLIFTIKKILKGLWHQSTLRTR